MMKPIDYVNIAADEFKKEGISKINLLKTRLANTDALDKLSKTNNLDMPIFDFSSDYISQEGLHRAIAAHKQKLNTIPVMVVYKNTNQLPSSLGKIMNK
jgi:hypothetical protein